MFILLSDLRNSATTTSCASCKLLLGALSLYKKDHQEGDDGNFLELRLAVGEHLQLYWRREPVIYIEIFTRDVDEGSVPATIGKTLEVSQNSSSGTCITLASSWIQECRTSHQHCHARSPTPLPTRVIDVSGSQPFLMETNGGHGDYIALSYCWGDDKTAVLKTLPSNYDAHCKEIPSSPDAMPKTIRDAIDICRRLKFKYIWIDALCIVQGRQSFQGPVPDFERESPRMASVYANATLTLGADAAEGNKEGIYRDQVFGEAPHKLLYGTSGAPVYVREQLARMHDDNALLQRLPTSPMSLTEPINMRAWTLPEAIFSNRMLHYTSEELVWECNEARWCECGRRVQVEAGGINSSNRVVRNENYSEGLTVEELYRHWRDILVLFSERQLGHKRDSDKFVALSRLARQFATILRIHEPEEAVKYLAGIWKGDIMKSLLWVVESDYARTLRDPKMQWRRPDTTEPRAPSWSWASVEAPVAYHPINKFLPKATVLDISIELLHKEEEYGEVKSGNLRISGPVCHGLQVTTRKATNKDSFAGSTNDIVCHIRNVQGESFPFICDDVLTMAHDSEEYSCLYIGRTDYSGEPASYYHAFLVLQKMKSGSYKRVGISTRCPYRYVGDMVSGIEEVHFKAKLSMFVESGVEEEITIE